MVDREIEPVVYYHRFLFLIIAYCLCIAYFYNKVYNDTFGAVERKKENSEVINIVYDNFTRCFINIGVLFAFIFYYAYVHSDRDLFVNNIPLVISQFIILVFAAFWIMLLIWYMISSSEEYKKTQQMFNDISSDLNVIIDGLYGVLEKYVRDVEGTANLPGPALCSMPDTKGATEIVSLIDNIPNLSDMINSVANGISIPDLIPKADFDIFTIAKELIG